MTLTIAAIPRSITNAFESVLSSTFTKHIVADSVDPHYIYLNNYAPYRYYCFNFIDNWAGADIGIRRIELQTGSTSQYPPLQNSTYVNATSYSINYEPYCATDPTKTLTGGMMHNSWVSAGFTSNQRFIIDLGSEKVINRVYYENLHSYGSYSTQGVKTFSVWGTNTNPMGDVTWKTNSQMIALGFTQLNILTEVGASIRFFPTTTSTKTISSYDWDFGDGTAHSTDACPIHVYPIVTTYTNYTVSLLLTFLDATTETVTETNFISSDSIANVSMSYPYTISVFLYNDTNEMLVHRLPWTDSNYSLVDPKITTSIDRIGTAKFSLTDNGLSTAAEQSLVSEGTNVIIIMGKSVVFSGIIRRAANSATSSFTSAEKAIHWDIECDSDLARHQKLDVSTTVLSATGAPVYDTTGNIARMILTNTPDIRGVIDTTGNTVVYQLNSATQTESVGNQYDHLTTLAAQNNYDLRSRPDYLVYPHDIWSYIIYHTFYLTDSSAAWDVNEFVGKYVFFIGTSKTGVVTYGKVASNTATRLTLTGVVGAEYTTSQIGTFIIYRGYKIDFAPDISQPSVVQNLDVNKTCFQYNDNDDKKKLSTKITVQGKDSVGKTIYVSVSGVHAYNETKQFFNDSTYVTYKSEGYVYKNTWNTVALRDVTVFPQVTRMTFVVTDLNTIQLIGGAGTVVTGQSIYFYSDGGTLPINISSGVRYYIVINSLHTDGADAHFQISGGGPNSAPMTLGSNTVGACVATTYGSLVRKAGTSLGVGTPTIRFSGTSPGNIAEGEDYLISYNADLADGSLWTAYDFGNVDLTVQGDTHAFLKSECSYPTGETDIAIWLYGWGYYINAAMTQIALTYNSTPISLSIIDTGTETYSKDGFRITKFQLGTPPTVDLSGYSNRGYLLCSHLWVKDKSLYTTGTVNLLFGEELIPVIGSGTGTLYGDYLVCNPLIRIPSSTLKAYPHGVGGLVAKTNYTEAAPETGSPIDMYGLRINPVTVDNNVTYSDLDSYATSLLLGLGNFWKKATTWSPLENGYVKQVGEYFHGRQSSVSRFISVGDNISITTFSGDTPESYEVVEATIVCNEGRVMLTLGDFEKNSYTSLLISTNGINKTLT